MIKSVVAEKLLADSIRFAHAALDGADGGGLTIADQYVTRAEEILMRKVKDLIDDHRTAINDARQHLNT